MSHHPTDPVIAEMRRMLAIMIADIAREVDAFEFRNGPGDAERAWPLRKRSASLQMALDALNMVQP